MPHNNISPDNADSQVVHDFGREWEVFNYEGLEDETLIASFESYFSIFPFNRIDETSEGFDMGCGSGRWARIMAPKVKKLNCIDPSQVALAQARKNLTKYDNCTFECAATDTTSLAPASQDFGYCLGVLHHMPDTLAGLQACTQKLSKGAPFLLYIYYRFDNRPYWFVMVWKISDVVRRLISKLPFFLRLAISQVIACGIYFPVARLARFMEARGKNVSNIPLSYYRNKEFYFMRNDALDRFGTKLEKRFTKKEIEEMMITAGLQDITFSDTQPHWVAVGIKK